MEHKYTIKEIDLMRINVSGRIQDETGIDWRCVSPKEVERRLRTYILAGIILEDMKAEGGKADT